jgi:probable F420-dependent oxidoreductase
MLVETSARNVPLADLPGIAKQVEEIGFDSFTQPEIKQDPFVTLALAATTTSKVKLPTSVAIVFPRSPMIVAYAARNVSDLSQGRFELGIGTQVKGHIQRRFSTIWDSPGPRLREYALAVRAIWDSWQNGTPLDFQGDFYSFTLMTPEFDLGPSDYYPIPIHLAAVNKYNIRFAGEYCNGLRVHSFTTPEYTRDVIWPNVKEGAKRSGRSLDSFEMIGGGGFIATGATEADVEKSREGVRHRIGHYASTRTYLPVLEHHGWEDVNPKLREYIAENRWSELSSLVSDDMLETFCVSGTYDQIVSRIRQRCEGLIDRINFPLPGSDELDPDALKQVVRELQSIPSPRDAVKS